MQGYHHLSRNGCSRLRSDLATQSLGLLPNLRSTDCNKVREKDAEEFENPTKAVLLLGDVIMPHTFWGGTGGVKPLGRVRSDYGAPGRTQQEAKLLPGALHLEGPCVV